MPIVEIKAIGFCCTRCEHEWIPRDIEQKPKVCPKCKSPYWDIERKTKATSK